MELTDLLDGRDVELRSATTKAQALAALADIVARRIGVDAEATLAALHAREAVGSTGVGNGVALPHARLEGLDRTHGVFLRLDAPVPFGAVDDQPVDLLFALFASADAGVDHLRALARVSRLLRSAELRQQLRLARTPDAVFALLAQEAHPSAA